jgi:hypothetical protein
VLDAVVRLYGHEGLFCEALTPADAEEEEEAKEEEKEEEEEAEGEDSRHEDDAIGDNDGHQRQEHRGQRAREHGQVNGRATPVATPRKPAAPPPFSALRRQLASSVVAGTAAAADADRATVGGAAGGAVGSATTSSSAAAAAAATAAAAIDQRRSSASGVPATCTWTGIWGSKCDVCQAQECLACSSVACSGGGGCETCRHSHPWESGGGALSHAGEKRTQHTFN